MLKLRGIDKRQIVLDLTHKYTSKIIINNVEYLFTYNPTFKNFGCQYNKSKTKKVKLVSLNNVDFDKLLEDID